MFEAAIFLQHVTSIFRQGLLRYLNIDEHLCPWPKLLIDPKMAIFPL